MDQPEQRLVAIERINPAPYNPRSMSNEEMGKLRRSLLEFGFVQPLVARAEDGLLIGGHQRLTAHCANLREGGASEAQVAAALVPVVLLAGVDDARAMALNLALNKIGGEWDYDKLGDVFVQLKDFPVVDLSGFTAVEVNDIVLMHHDPIPAHDNDSEEGIQREVEAQLNKFTFAAPSKADADSVREVLKLFGHTGPGDIASAFLAIVNVAKAHPPAPQDSMPLAPRKGRKKA